MVALVAFSAAIRSAVNVPAVESQTQVGAGRAQQIRLGRRADDADQRDLLLEAQPVEHLAQVGGGGGVDQRGVPLHPHGLHHAQYGHRVDERRRPVGAPVPGRQFEAGRGGNACGTARTWRRLRRRPPCRAAPGRPSELPAATTVPAPSLPAGSDCPARAAAARAAAGRQRRGDHGPGRASRRRMTRLMSAPANSIPRSDGLIGAASTG